MKRPQKSQTPLSYSGLQKGRLTFDLRTTVLESAKHRGTSTSPRERSLIVRFDFEVSIFTIECDLQQL